MTCGKKSRVSARGMSLVELLVVVAILGLLAIAVLPNLANTSESRRSREAMRSITSFIASAKSRAIGRREWSGLAITAPSPGASAGIDMFLADVPEVYRGDTVSATLTISGSTATTRTASDPAAIELFMVLGGTTQDFIRFENRGPWYQIDHNPNPGPPLTPTSLRFEHRGQSSGANDDVGHEQRNTPWPPGGVPLSFEIQRQPTITGTPETISGSRCIDFRWSGFGPASPSLFRRFPESVFGPELPIDRVFLLFDGTGRLRQVCSRFLVDAAPAYRVDRFSVTGQVYLLVGRIDRAGQDEEFPLGTDNSRGANWQYADSFWVGLDPFTGITKLAECYPNPSGATWMDRLFDSQRWIREAFTTGGL
jgi:prepilin-type N-terminal cleavage/methylation domain-containing protein